MNGLFGTLVEGGGPIVPSLLNGLMLVADGLKILAGEGIAESIEPKRPENEPAMGDRELGSKVIVELSICGMPLILSPEGSSSGLGVGGVGVRGGAGIGRLEAMFATALGSVYHRKYRVLTHNLEEEGRSTPSHEDLHFRIVPL